MDYAFNKSVKGYSHIKSEKPCQDYSALFRDNERTIITCCDGHGGDVYIRSNIGSQIASNSIMNVFSALSSFNLRKSESEEEMIQKIKLNLLCEWNRQVEEHLSKRPVRMSECAGLDENKIEALRDNPARAFGTTMTGAMVMRNKLVIAGIGDTEVLGIRRGEMLRLLGDEADPAANVTYSMCQEDAFNYLRVKILDWKDFDGILLCSDGMSSPYQSYENFNNSFIKQMVMKLLETDGMSYISDFVDDMATKLGTGDDVSLSFIIKDSLVKRYYKDF